MAIKPLSIVFFTALTALSLTTTAHAACNGFYIGGQLGWADTHMNDWRDSDDHSHFSDFFNGRNVDTTGLAGGGLIGYQYTQNWAIEIGGTAYTNATDNVTFPNIDGVGGTEKLSLKIQEQSYDIAVKGIVPFCNGFAAYAKLGPALVHGKATVDDDVTSTVFGNSTFTDTTTKNNVYPLGTIGLSFDVTPNFVIDASYTRIQKLAQNNDSLPSIDYVAGGLTWHFG